jgi:hypothetical protein
VGAAPSVTSVTLSQTSIQPPFLPVVSAVLPVVPGRARLDEKFTAFA